MDLQGWRLGLRVSYEGQFGGVLELCVCVTIFTASSIQSLTVNIKPLWFGNVDVHLPCETQRNGRSSMLRFRHLMTVCENCSVLYSPACRLLAGCTFLLLDTALATGPSLRPTWRGFWPSNTSNCLRVYGHPPLFLLL